MQNTSNIKNEKRNQIDVFNTYIEAIKFSFKHKPMWKFIVTFLAISSLGFSTVIYTICFSSLFPFFSEQNPSSFFSDPSFTGALIAVLVFFSLYIIVTFLGGVIVTTGSIISTWTYELQSPGWQNKTLHRSLGKRKFVFIFLLNLFLAIFNLGLFALLIAGNIYAFSENNFLLVLFILLFDFLLLPICLLVINIVTTAYPIVMLENLTVKAFLKKIYTYIESYFWKLFVARLIVYAGQLLVSMVISIANQVILFLAYIVIIICALLFITMPNLVYPGSFLMAFFIAVFSMPMIISSFIMLGIEQNYYTLLYCRLEQSFPSPSPQKFSINMATER